MNKLIKRLVYILLATLMIGVSLNASELDIEDGMWEWTTVMEMSGMSLPPMTYSSCITKEDLIPQESSTEQQCKMIKNKIVGNSVVWKMECSSEAGISTSEGKMTYNSSTAKGEIKITTQGMTMISKIKGHRTGGCK